MERYPTITEDVETLKRQFKAERQLAKRQRLEVLYLLASQPVHSRSDLATVFGGSRNTIAVWLRAYAAGGFPALLDVDVPVGKPPALTAPQLAQLTAHLNDPSGIPSYVEVQRCLNTTFGLDLTYNAVRKLVRYKRGAKLRVPLPSHPKNMEPRAIVEAQLATRLQDAISADNHLPVRVWASDESRFGLHTIRRCRLTARGVNPIGIHQHRCG